MIYGQAVTNYSQGPTPQFVWPDLEYGQAGLGLTWKQSTLLSTLQCRLLLLQQPTALPTVMAAHHHRMLRLKKLHLYFHYPYMPMYLTANSKENFNLLLYGSLKLT
jgi:hypothetical protein